MKIVSHRICHRNSYLYYFIVSNHPSCSTKLCTLRKTGSSMSSVTFKLYGLMCMLHDLHYSNSTTVCIFTATKSNDNQNVINIEFTGSYLRNPIFNSYFIFYCIFNFMPLLPCSQFQFSILKAIRFRKQVQWPDIIFFIIFKFEHSSVIPVILLLT